QAPGKSDGTGGPASGGPAKGATPPPVSPDGTSSAPGGGVPPGTVKPHLGNPDSPVMGQPVFDGKPPTSAFHFDSGGGTGVPSIGDPSTRLTNSPPGAAGPHTPGVSPPGVSPPGVGTPGGPVTLGPGAAGGALIPPSQRTAITTSGPSRRGATGSST